MCNLLPGIAIGILLQQMMMAILSNMVRVNYGFHLRINGYTLLAMFRCRRKFRKMNILAFWTVFPNISSLEAATLFLVLLVVDIYLFYRGLSAWIICYIRKRKDGIYKGETLFLLQQFPSKLRAMQFTMGTLTALFTIALMGCSVAMMFSDFENKLLDTKWPFDVLIYSADPKDDFEDVQKVITQNSEENDHYIYRIYTDEQNQANTWMLLHI